MAEYSAIYEDAVDRIKAIYHSCSIPEQKLLRDILQEMSVHGYSYTLEKIWLSDFKEIPVDIDTFICDPHYMGPVNRNGEAIYPYWRKFFRNIFNAGNKYNSICLTGSTRVGKTSSSIVVMAYMLYRLMLYRNPHEYFQKKEVSRFTLGFANLTKELAMSVAYREFNDTLRDCPFFMDHGKISASVRNFYYVPEGNKIEIIPASDAAMLLGKQLWCCLVGNTKIITYEGTHEIKDLDGSTSNILQYDYHQREYKYVEAEVNLTKYVTETIRIELEDGSVIEGTSDHRIMLSDGSYKRLDELTKDDDILEVRENVKLEFDDYSLKKKQESEEGNATNEIKKITKISHKDPIPVYDVINAGELHNFVIHQDNGINIISHNCCMDEVNFSKAGVKDIAKAKLHMKNLYDTANARISGTFRVGGEVYGKMIVSSSKNSDSDFLSDYIEQQQKAGNEHLYVVDEPQWNILPKSMFSDKVFHFTVGDRYKRGFVIPEENDDEEHRKEYEAQGYKVIEAPAELRVNFLADYDIALRDIAGISVTGAMGFITQESITPCVAQDRVNPFYEDILTIGTRDKSVEIYDFFHLDAVPNELKYQQLNIHVDFAETRNRTGISGTCVCGNKVIEQEDGKKIALPFLKQVFVVGIQAPRGDRQSFQKVINFIAWLRQNHFNIGTISCDRYQSSFVIETLNQQNFNTDRLSISTDMDPFIGLKNLLIDQRIELVKSQKQEDELVSIQRLNNKINIPEDSEGGHGDLATALVGSSWSLIKDKVTARPPAKNLASIAAAVNKGRGRSPMSSSNTIRSNTTTSSYPTRFPRLR